MLGNPDGAFRYEFPQPGPRVEEAELKVQEMERSRPHGHVSHRRCFFGVAPEWLVAQHGSAALDGQADILEVHERRRVNRHKVDLVAQLGHLVPVPRRHDTDNFAAVGRLERRGRAI
jgi:hypothetical protein